jgi:exopolyphosphatase / guanosine-5'-triphosphate,3'-diphosphate pyrophosphatase
MVCACIDIGSNTTRLLVAEAEDGQLREVLQQRAFTRLGAKGGISPAKLEVCTEAVATQLRVARECGAEHVRVVGTHALRQAPNRDELIAAVEAATGETIDILSGDDEARYAFLGATRTLGHLPLGDVGVVDVGGGSTEIVVGTLADGVTWAESFRIGSGYLADHYLRSDPPALTELDHLRRHVQGVFEGLDVPQPRVAYAVGGSATSLRRLVGAVLDHESLTRGMRVLAERPAAVVAREFELHVERVKLLPAGMLLLDAVAELLGTELRVAKGGLREGVLLAELEAAGVLH